MSGLVLNHSNSTNEKERPDSSSNGSPRIILVLGGGGMRGYAHIGVIRAVEKLGLTVSEIVGTSMGAVMGGLFATGLNSQEVEEAASEISLKDYFRLKLLKFLVKGYRHASVEP